MISFDIYNTQNQKVNFLERKRFHSKIAFVLKESRYNFKRAS